MVTWPMATRSIMAVPFPAAGRAASELELLGNDLLHDLGGAAPDGHEARVAEEALDRVLAHVPVAAVELYAVIRDLLGHVRGEELDHGDLLHHVNALGERAAGGVGQGPPRLDEGGEIG